MPVTPNPIPGFIRLMRASPVYIYLASSQFPSPESRYQLQHVQYTLPGFSIAAEDRRGGLMMV